VACYYEVSAFLGAGSTTYASTNFATIIINQNSTAIASGSNQLSGSLSGTIYVNSSAIALCAAGDTLYMQGQTNNSSATVSVAQMNIKRLSGPAVVQQSESVNAAYNSSAGQTVATGGTQLIFGTKLFDSHNQYNASTGVYTSPMSGTYFIDFSSSQGSGTGSIDLNIFVNGAHIKNARAGNGTSSPVVNAHALYKLNAGDQVSCAMNGYSGALTTDNTQNTFNIYRVGN
jgi:hypothetical protein